MKVMELAALIEWWERTSEHHNFSPPSTEHELVEATSSSILCE